MPKNTDHLDLGRILTSAVEAALGEDGQHDESDGRDRRGGGHHTMRRVATGIAVATVARVAVSKGPKLVTKAAPKLMNLPNLSDVSDRVSGMTERVRDNLADRGWLGEEDDDYEGEAVDDEEGDEPEDEEEDLSEDEEDEEPEDEEEDFPDDEEDDEPEDEEEDLPEDEFDDEDEDEEDEDGDEDVDRRAAPARRPSKRSPSKKTKAKAKTG